MLEYINKLLTIQVTFAPSTDWNWIDSFSERVFSHTYRGGVTGAAQVNDTAYHKDSKAVYRKKEMQLMLDDLTENRNKIPQLSRDQKMQMFNYAWDEVYTKIDCVDAYKKTMMTLAFSGSEDHLANKKLMELVGKDILAFREELIKPQLVPTMKGLKKQIITPKDSVEENKVKTLTNHSQMKVQTCTMVMGML